MQQQDCHVASCNDPSTPSDLIQCRLSTLAAKLTRKSRITCTNWII